MVHGNRSLQREKVVFGLPSTLDPATLDEGHTRIWEEIVVGGLHCVFLLDQARLLQWGQSFLLDLNLAGEFALPTRLSHSVGFLRNSNFFMYNETIKVKWRCFGVVVVYAKRRFSSSEFFLIFLWWHRVPS